MIGVVLVFYLVFLSISTIYAFEIYVNAFRKYYGEIWHYGYKEAITYVCDNHSNYDKVIITDMYGRLEPKTKTIPHLYTLVYCDYDPAKYQNNKNIFNIEIRNPHWFNDINLKNTLLIGSHWDFPENFPENWIIKTIYFPSGEPALHLVETSADKYYKKVY